MREKDVVTDKTSHRTFSSWKITHSHWRKWTRLFARWGWSRRARILSLCGWGGTQVEHHLLCARSGSTILPEMSHGNVCLIPVSNATIGISIGSRPRRLGSYLSLTQNQVYRSLQVSHETGGRKCHSKNMMTHKGVKRKKKIGRHRERSFKVNWSPGHEGKEK